VACDQTCCETTTEEVRDKTPRLKTCPLCKMIKSERAFKNQVFLDGVLTDVCGVCYSVRRNDPYAGLLYG
jgi:hypothetical protein